MLGSRPAVDHLPLCLVCVGTIYVWGLEESILRLEEASSIEFEVYWCQRKHSTFGSRDLKRIYV